MATSLATFTLALALGCTGSRPCGHEQRHPAREYLGVQPDASAAILFDAVPGYDAGPGTRPISAQDFAYRSPWPSTVGYEYSGGEAVFYREWYYDHQGTGFDTLDHVHRDFRSVRVGAKFR